MTPRSSIAAKPDEEVYELSTADSIAPRVYVRFVLCFPFDEALASKAEAVRSLQHALDSAVASWPHLSGQLQVVKSDGPGRGRMVLRCASAAGGRSRSLIKLNVKHLTDKSRLNYGDLASNGFPEGRLDGDRLISISDVPSNDFPAPVLDVQATFVPGGLLLTIYFHHTVCDAYCMGKLIDLMSAATRGEKPPSDLVPAQLRNEVLERSLDTSHKDPAQLVKRCPEHVISSCTIAAGPSQPVRSSSVHNSASPPTVRGWIFALSADGISQVKKSLTTKIRQRHGSDAYISTNDVLAAMSWVHITTARSRTVESPLLEPKTSKITIPINHRDLSDPPLGANYAGYAISVTTALLPVTTLLQASAAPELNFAFDAFADVVWTIRKAKAAVDESFVRRRLELGRAVSDMRDLNLDCNLEDNLDLSFNTWSTIGMDSEWNIPGVPRAPVKKGAQPDAIRRAHHGWMNGFCIILPRRTGSSQWEVLVQLRGDDMNRLAQDKTWMRWVSKVIG